MSPPAHTVRPCVTPEAGGRDGRDEGRAPGRCPSLIACASNVSLCLLLGTFLSAPSFGREAETDSLRSQLREELARSDALFLQSEPDSALDRLTPILRKSQAAHLPEIEMRARVAQARILATVGRPRPAEESARLAHELAVALKDTLAWCESLRWLSVTAEQSGRIGESRAFAESLLALSTDARLVPHQASAHLSLAYADLVQGRPAHARPQYEQALKLFVACDRPQFGLMARVGLARCLDDLGDFDEARQSFLTVLAESRMLGDPYNEAHALNNLGALEYQLGDPSAAVGFYQEALDLQLGHGNPEGSIAPATNIAQALADIGRYEEASVVLHGASDLCDSLGYSTSQAMVLEELGRISRAQGRPQEATGLFRRAASLASAHDPERYVRCLLGLAETLASMDSLSASLEILRERVDPLKERLSPPVLRTAVRLEGEILFELGQPREALGRSSVADQLSAPLGLGSRVAPLVLAGRCYLALGDPDSAGTVLRRAAGVWEEERARSRDPEWREQLDLDSRELYATLARYLLEHQPDVPEEARAREAFSVLQRFKARTLAERVFGPRGTESVDLLPARTLTADEVGDLLDPDELLIDAFVGKEECYVFVIDRSHCRAIRIACSGDELERRSRRFREVVASPPLDRGMDRSGLFVRQAAASISDLLLLPIADLLGSSRRILFSPDGPLNLLPFEALTEPGQTDRPDRPLLIQSHEIVHIPSAALWVRGKQASRGGRAEEAQDEAQGEARTDGRTEVPAGSSSGILAVAGKHLDGAPDLPGAAEEVAWICRRYRRATNASRIASKEIRLEDFEVLHLAGHTQLFDARPWRSGLLLDLGSSESDSTEDPYLRGYQIARMHLGADLVVLSGCESAGGRVISGEGVLGIATAFLASGVSATVATLWPVSDQVTSRLMQAFYHGLEREETVAQALRAAQDEVRSRPETAPPFYWAGFVVIGNGEQRVVLSRRPPPTKWISSVLLLLGGLLLSGLLLARTIGQMRRARPGAVG